MSEVEVYRHKSSGDEVARGSKTNMGSRSGGPKKPEGGTPRRVCRRRSGSVQGNFGCSERGRQEKGMGRRYLLTVTLAYLQQRIWDANDWVWTDRVLLIILSAM